MKGLFTFDRIMAIVVVPVAAFLINVAYKAPRTKVPQTVGPHVWPIILLSLIIACAIALFLQTIRQERKTLAADTVPKPESNLPWYRKPAAAGALTILGLVVYSAFLPTLGFIICTTLLVIYQSRVIQRGRWMRNVVSAVAFTLAIYFAFSRLLLVKLPPGLLDW